MDEVGVFFIKIVFLLVISPVWFPVAKAFWKEANLTLYEEGGIFGRIPTQSELERQRSAAGWRPDPLVHEPWGTGPGARRRAATIQHKEGKDTPKSPVSSDGPQGRRF